MGNSPNTWENTVKKTENPDDIAASHILEGVMEHHRQSQADKVSFGELLHSLHERGFAFLMMIFVLPNCVPVPIPPGMSTIFSIPILFLAVQMAWGRDAPWLPSWLANKTIKRTTLAKIIEVILPRLRKVERILKRRHFYAEPATLEKVVGVICIIYGLSIAVPFPMTNFLPGVGIFLMSLGLLSRDGLVMLLGVVIGLIGVAFTTSLVLLGKAVVMSMLPIDPAELGMDAIPEE